MFSIKKNYSHNINRFLGKRGVGSEQFNKSQPKAEQTKTKQPGAEQALARLQGGNNRRINKQDNRSLPRLQKRNESFLHLNRNQTLSNTMQRKLSRFRWFKWQNSFHDHIIRNDRDFWNHYHYTIWNFIHHKGYPSDYIYSSENSFDLIDEFE